MNIERALQYTMAVLAALGTLLLGMGSYNVILPVVAIFVAATSLYFTDQLGWIRLNRNVASLAALTAVGISVIDFFQLGRDRQLLAIAYLLIYLQIVLMYQRKDVRVYWQLLMLSLLQVVVAAALNFGMLFGALLIVYMFLGLFALSLFFIYREIVQLNAAPEQQKSRRAGRTATRRAGGENSDAAVGGSIGLDGALANAFRDGALRSGLWRRVLTDGLLTLAMTLAFFFLVPRFGDTSPIRRITARRMVGFTETVKLGTLGTAIQNPQAVMRVWFEDPKAREPYRIHGEPMFRGTVVNHYDGGTWSLKFLPNHNAQLQGLVLPLPPLSQRGVRPVYQRISLEPLPEATVCAVFPPLGISKENPIAYDVGKQQLIRLASNQHKMEFTIATRGLQRGVQRSITPVDAEVELTGAQDLTQLPTFVDGRDPLEQLKKVAAEVVGDSAIPSSDPIGRARALERFLRDSPRFQYTLTAPNRDPALDPIEDFMTSNPRGHCEYFSSALTLMLRSQGIPARMVIGFKGGQWNSLGGYYQVRQLHAHSWVEAYLEDIPWSQQPEGRLAGVAMPGWLRLDPTPGADTEETASTTSQLTDLVNEWTNYAEFLWSNYIVDLNAKRQQQGIYEPLAGVGEAASALLSKRFWTESVPNFFQVPVTGPAGSGAKSKWSFWRIGLASTLALLLVLLFRQVAKRLRDRINLRRFGRGRTSIPKQTITVEFYRRLEELLRAHGLQRPSGQTQHEFAVVVGGQISERPAHATAAGIPKQIVRQYYRVRYGGAMLDSQETAAVEQALNRLKTTLNERA